MAEKLTTIAQLKKQALMSKADSAARVAELAELMAAGLEDSQIGFTVTLPAANWNGRVQTVKHKSLLADSSYWYVRHLPDDRTATPLTRHRPDMVARV